MYNPDLDAIIKNKYHWRYERYKGERGNMNTLKKITHAVLSLCILAIFCGIFVPTNVSATNLYDYEDDYENNSYEDYSEYIYVYCESPTMELTVGETKAVDIEIVDEYDTNSELSWESSDPSIASVNSNGVVKAKKPGKTTITVRYGGDKDKCVVTVKKKAPTYKQAAAKLKKIAQKNKNFIFKTINKGKVCRLYAIPKIKYASSDYKFITEGYLMECTFWEYIEIRKKGIGSIVKLKVGGLMQEVNALHSVSLTASQLKVKTSNRKLSFDFDETESRSYHTGGIYGSYCAYSEAQAVIASSLNKDRENLKKFNKMLGQKSLTLRFQCYGGAYYQMGVYPEARKNWRSLNRIFSDFVKSY